LNSKITSQTRITISSRVFTESRSIRDVVLCRRTLAIAILAVWFLSTVAPLHSREPKRRKEDYGQGLTTEIAAPQNEVLDAVETVVNNGIIRGSKEYNKDQYIEGASPAASSPLLHFSQHRCQERILSTSRIVIRKVRLRRYAPRGLL